MRSSRELMLFEELLTRFSNCVLSIDAIHRGVYPLCPSLAVKEYVKVSQELYKLFSGS